MRNALSLYDANKARDKTLVCGASSISCKNVNTHHLSVVWHAVSTDPERDFVRSR